ncbi:polyprenyl diphosphate synthase [Amycolatopsis sp. cmx-11-12]|uniref:polyprenyl diphosphate synthase n=1 Tax=Amycolatopsis sp. cmx-11-12 TaxID=2785795 RepID=UPI003918165A
MSVRTRIDDLYARRLRARLLRGPLPRHVGVIIDGNRRWARQMGFEDVREGHRHGAQHIARLMTWCEGLGIGHVTVYLASVDNLTKRASPEMTFLMQVIEDVVRERLTAPGANWRIAPVGRLDLLPSSTAEVLKQAEEDTRGATGPELTLAIGYGSREEIVDAVRDLVLEGAADGKSLVEIAETVSVESLSAHLYTAGSPEPDLIIRTSGEVRLSGFLLWQAKGAQLYFCDVNWPGFRYLDLLRALRVWAAKGAETISRD